MRRATISQFKNRLSAYLDQVKSGETLLICDREVPIARVERVGGESSADERLARLERAGLLRRATRPIPFDLLREGVDLSAPVDSGVLQALLDERADGR